MKTSSGLLLGVLFTLVVVIVALVIYFNTRPEEEKPKTLTDPSTTLPSIDDFTISRTDSPDSNSETYSIEPYTIEYLTPEEEAAEAVYQEGDNEKALSKNVKFTLNWENGNGYNNVEKLKIDHYIVTSDDGTITKDLKKTYMIIRSDNDKNYSEAFTNYGSVEYSISGDGSYSFMGKNRFIITAVLNYKETGQTANKEVFLYKGLTNEDGDEVTDIGELDVLDEDLTATIGMTESVTKEFKLKLQEQTNSASSVVKNTKYKFKSINTETPSTPFAFQIDGVELIPQDNTGVTFKFRINDNYVKAEIETDIKVTNPATPKYAKYSVGATSDKDAIITFVFNTIASDTKRMLKTTISGKDYYLFGQAKYNLNANGVVPQTPGIIWKELSDVSKLFDSTKTWTVTEI